MNIALIVAGGNGERTGQSVPKQFLTINDIPVIVYTMENIKQSGCFDELYVVCADGWKDFIESYAEQYNIDIYCGTISGGPTRFDSFSNGIDYISRGHSGKDIISITDGNRPLTPSSLFRSGISGLSGADCTVPVEPCYDTMYVLNGKNYEMINETADRTILFRGQVPETAVLCTAEEVCRKARIDGEKSLPLAALMLKYGKAVRSIPGISRNFKITTFDDFAIFKAILNSEEEK